MWALLPVKPLASGFTGQVFLILVRFPPLSLCALFQGFCILTLISPLGSWGYPADVDFWDLLAKIAPLCLCLPYFKAFGFLTLVSTLGPWGYPPVVDFWDLSAKMCIFFVMSFTPIAPPRAGLYSEPLFQESLWHQA
jgi:hypothetical protein